MGTAAAAEELACRLLARPRKSRAWRRGTSCPCRMNESSRLLALQSYDIMDSAQELRYDDITLLASQICHTPMALITLINEDRQWFKSKSRARQIRRHRESLRDSAHTPSSSRTKCSTVVDARLDDRFASQSICHWRSSCSLLRRRTARVRGRSCTRNVVRHRSRATDTWSPIRRTPCSPCHGRSWR